MAETQVASTGWNGEVWLSSDTTEANLAELVGVRSFKKKRGTLGRAPTTTLKTPNREQTSTPTLRENGDAEIVLNARRGSTTFLNLMAAYEAGDNRLIRFNYPELGDLVWTDDVLGYVSDIDEGEVDAEQNMEITVTVTIEQVVDSAAYSAPAP